MDGFVYLLGDTLNEGVYKIGKTKNDVKKRIKQLQTGNPSEIYLVKSYKTKYPSFLEHKLHLKYAFNKERNEWFNLSDEEVSDFEGTCERIQNLVESLENNPFMEKILK